MSRTFLFLALVTTLSASALGQSPLPGTVVSCPAESGSIRNPVFIRTEVWAQTVNIPGASSYQLEFGEIELEDPTDAIIVTNPLDGEVQRLDGAALKLWRNRSAWFNGSVAILSLELSPGSSGSVRLDSALALTDAPGGDDICGSDNRVPSSDNRVCRLIINGNGICTGWLISDRSVILTAGHCFGSATNPAVVAQFNVPPSTASGGIVQPPVASQFPLDSTTLQSQDGGVGNDWAVARLHPNTNGIPAGLAFTSFSLPTSSPPTSMTGRLTGYGADPTPDPTRNFAQQSSTDSLSFPFTVLGPISHDIDSQGGNSGGPLVREGTNTAVGIHTHGGCSNFLGSNRGTSIFNPNLSQAIATTLACAGTHLLDGASQQITCSPTIYSAGVVQNRWNVVAVSGNSDWDIFRENTGSIFGGSACDFLIANGTLGTVPPLSGEIRRFSGSSTARAQFSSAQILGLGQNLVDSWSQGRVLKVYQVLVPSGTPSLNVSVAGDATLNWQLYFPGTGISSQWGVRGTNLLASGSVGGSSATGIIPPVSGTYCLVVFRNNAPFSVPPSPPTLSVSVCAGGSAPVALTASTPTVLPAGCGEFSITPTPGTYNVVGVASTGNYTLTMGPGTSATSGSATEFVAYNGLIGNVSPTTGNVTAVSGSAPATVEHVVATEVPFGSMVSTSLAAGHVLRAMRFTVQGGNTGPHEILVTGHPSLRWYLFDPGFGWRGRSLVLRSGVVGSTGATLSLVAGLNCLVIAQDGGVPSVNLPFSVRWGLTSDHITLPGPGTSVGNLGNPSYQFTCTPAPGRWNAVGILNTTTALWALSIGNAESASTGSGTLYVLADGHAGSIAPTDGLLNHFGVFPGSLHQSGITTLSLGTGTVTWTSMLLHTFEFFVATAGDFDINVTGAGGLGWALFTPDSTSAWRSRTTAALTRGVGTAENGVSLNAGWHAIVVSRGATPVGPPQGSVITCSVTQSQNPAPVLTSLTPASLPAGSPQTTIVLNGTGIGSSSTATWDGSTNLNVLARSATHLQVVVPASFIAAPGSHAIRIVNPAPGGGTSSPRTFTARAPRVLSVTPTSIAPITQGGAPIPIVVTGQDFHSLSLIHAGIPIMPTTFVSSTELRSFLMETAPEAMEPGAVSITVENGYLAQSNTVVVEVNPGGNNRGTLVRAPLIPNPNELYTARLEGCRPGSRFTVIIDFANPAPTLQWPNAAADFVLRLGTPEQTFVLVDGMGLVAPPNPGLVFGFDPNGTAPGGVFTLTGFTMPPSSLGARFSMQTAYVDPTSPVGFTLTWARTEDL